MDGTGIYLGTLDANAPTRLISAAGGGVYVPSGPGSAGVASVGAGGHPDARGATAGCGQGRAHRRLDGTRTTRFTFDPARDYRPVWSPDGTRIVFHSNRTGLGDLYQKLASRAGAVERIVASDQPKIPSSWSADSRFLIYYSIDQRTEADLWVVPMRGELTPSVFLKTPLGEAVGAFSPDGRWVAYQQTTESGGPELYVRPFVPPGALRLRSEQAADTAAGVAGSQWQVSTAGGTLPVWRPDGQELYYIDPAGAMMAAPIRVLETTLEPGAPMMLFPTRIVGGGGGARGRNYDVAPDGRFLIDTELPGDAAPITLIQHWNPEAKK